MSTATIAFVRSVIAASTAAGSMFRVAASMSANTGVAPSKRKQLAEAANENGEVITSSPGPMPAMRQSRWSPAVPLDTAAAYGAPTPMQLMAYENQKKSAPLALVLEFFLFPGIGSLYADHAQGALLTWACSGGGLALVIVGVTRLPHDTYDPQTGTYVTTGSDDSAGPFIVAGVLAILAGRIYGLVDSWQSANAYNANLARRIGLPAMTGAIVPMRTDRGLAWGPALQLRF